MVAIINRIKIIKHTTQYKKENSEKRDLWYLKVLELFLFQIIRVNTSAIKNGFSLVFLLGVGKEEAKYMKIISIPPKKAKVKIRGIQGELIWIHLEYIIVRVKRSTPIIKSPLVNPAILVKARQIKIVNVTNQNLV